MKLRFKMFDLKGVAALIAAFFLVVGVCQTALALDAEDYLLGDIPLDQATYEKLMKPVPQDRVNALPASYNAISEGIVTAAKDQGACGSCWAFASVGALESHILKQGGPLYDLSEEQQNRCNLTQDGCRGGYSTALQYWETNDPITEACYPYTATDGPCSHSCTEMDYRIEGFYTVSQTTAGFKQSLYDDGPSYWRFTVYSDFYDYWNDGSKGAVYKNTSGTSFQGGHAVLIIGWDDAKGAFLCKNSWGQNAGPNGNGTFWIAYSGHYNNLGFGMSNFTLAGGPDLIIDIKANASDGPVTIAPGDTLSVSVQLDSGDKEGEYADWWVLAKLPPGGWYHYKLSGWKPDISYVKQGPIHDVPAKQVLNTSTLAEGTYTFYFGVDTMMNGKIDMGALHYDTVEVNITTTTDTCGAFVTPNVWKEFDCYNLAAIGKTTGDNLFTPSWRLVGGYWQWGRKGPSSSQWYDTNTEHFAHGPTGPGDTEANEGEISNWDDVYPPNGSWSDNEKTANDPCPTGFRVPTIAQWDGVVDNNTQSILGTWDSNPTNYSSASFFGDDLMLPAAGFRNNFLSSGALDRRGYFGYYWSNSEDLSSNAWLLYFSSGIADTGINNRLYGFSVRCISE